MNSKLNISEDTVTENKSILIVEDDVIALLASRVTLEKRGYTVHTAISGEKGIEITRNFPVDLVLMDIDLGGEVDGIKAAQVILSEKNVPILFLTAHVEKETVERVRNVTRYGYTLKNSGEYVLLSTIEMVFDLYEAHEKTRVSEENYKSLVEDINDVIFSINEYGIFTYVSPRIMHFTDYSPDEIIGKSFHEFISLDDVSRAREQFEIITTGGSFFEEYKWIKKNGGHVWFRFSSSPVFHEGEFRGFKGLLMDISFRKRAEEQMRVLLEEKEKLLRELNCLYSISRIMEDNTGNLDDLLSQIVELIPDALSFPCHSFAEISYSGKVHVSTRDIRPGKIIERKILIHGKHRGHIKVGYFADAEDAGTVFFDDRDRGFFDTITERIVKIIELFIARDELKKLEREVIDITEKERQKIGHELHDSLGQILTGVSFMLKNVKNQLNGSSGTVKERISEISHLVQDATTVCRQISRGLPLVNIKHNTLLMALDQLAISTRDIFNINCEVSFSGEIELKDDFVSSQLYRITQEAVNNAVKHSGAKNIYISLNGSPGVHLSVVDDGCGFSDDKKEQGMGLSIMKYRTDLINGEFHVQNGAECGFTVSVSLP